MSIATKTGDNGSTSLLFGRRVSKAHPRVVSYGRVDELSSALGVCRAHCNDASSRAHLRDIQVELIHFMGELATDDADQQDYQSKYSEKLIRQAQIDRLTAWIQDKETQTRFDGWTQAGDTIADSFFDQARTTCRRAERGLVALQESGAVVRQELIIYLNRLADLLWLWGVEHAQIKND